MQIKTSPGRIIEKEIELKNNLHIPQNITIQFNNLEQFFLEKNKTITLGPEEVKKIKIMFIIKENTKPGILFGQIKVGSKIIDVQIIIENNNLFDLSVDLKNKLIIPPKNLIFSINLKNINQEIVKTKLTYLVYDQKNQLIINYSRQYQIISEKTIKESIKLPKKISPGKYTLFIKLKYEDKYAIAKEEFTLIKINYQIAFLLLIITIILIILEGYIISSSKSRGK